MSPTISGVSPLRGKHCSMLSVLEHNFSENQKKSHVRNRQLMDRNHLLHSRHQLTNRRSLVTAIYNHFRRALKRDVKVINWNHWSLRIFCYLSHLCSDNNRNMEHWPHRQTRSTSCRRKHKIWMNVRYKIVSTPTKYYTEILRDASGCDIQLVTFQ